MATDADIERYNWFSISYKDLKELQTAVKSLTDLLTDDYIHTMSLVNIVHKIQEVINNAK